MKTLSRIIAILIFTAACNSKPEQGDRKKILEDSIKYTLEEYLKSIESGALEEQLAFYDDSSAFYWIPAGSSKCLSRDSFLNMLRAKKTDPASATWSWTDLKVSPLNEHFANFKGTIEKKSAAGLLRSNEEGVLVKRARRWKFLFGHSSTVE